MSAFNVYCELCDKRLGAGEPWALGSRLNRFTCSPPCKEKPRDPAFGLIGGTHVATLPDATAKG